MTPLIRFFCVWMIGTSAFCLRAEQSSSAQGSSSQGSGPPAAPVSVVTDPGYKLSIGDQISVAVFEEPKLTVNQLIDRDGVARLAWIGDTKLIGLTVREAEHAVEALYRERGYLKKPVVTLVVTAFSPREVLVTGAVNSQGNIAFPRDATVMDIVDVIVRAGNFKPGARQNAVLVKHKDADGRETVSTVDVGSMMSARKSDQKSSSFPIYPGDLIQVPMSIF
jgi:protein involved in polysaccharide export with SLBB domain